MLTDARIRKIKPEAKTKRYADEKGMYLEVTPSGGMYWRLKYRIDGKENRYSIGVYGEVSLAEARAKRDEARKLIAQGIDPNQAKKQAKDIIDNVNCFEVWARKWLLDRQSTIKPDTYKRDSSLLEQDIIPFIGKTPIDQIRSPEILAAARKIEDRGAGEMARRAIRLSGRVFRQAMREGVATYDPTDGLTEALKPRKVTNMVRIDAKDLPELLSRIDAYDGDVLTRLGLKFINLTFARTIEIRFMEWAEIDFEAKEWRIPANKMKKEIKHIVPLSAQALEILEQIQAMGLNSPYVFFNTASRKPYSENFITNAIARMGYKGRMTGHGFRGLASTILHEQGYLHDAIERQLSHNEKNKVAAAYNHAQHLPYRRQMMQDWANYLDNVRTGKVLQFVKAS
ncbi:MAG: integrase arm-type DNA-binding domain-containing protein [Pseudomonadales bacterium]|nr:integrase arm-type DNA-binding domain-containing protein [Pseudomonadales bacterium]